MIVESSEKKYRSDDAVGAMDDALSAMDQLSEGFGDFEEGLPCFATITIVCYYDFGHWFVLFCSCDDLQLGMSRASCVLKLVFEQLGIFQLMLKL